MARKKQIMIDPMVSPLESAIEIKITKDIKPSSKRTEKPKSKPAPEPGVATEAEKLDGLLEKTRKTLYSTKNIIPLLRDELIIDSGKVTIIYRPFFFSERIQSVSIQDISDVYIETAPFFATIKIIDKDFVDNRDPNDPNRAATPSPLIIRFLWKKNAEKARRIVTGLMTASKENIDLKTIDDKNLAAKLEEIGDIRKTVTSVTNA